MENNLKLVTATALLLFGLHAANSQDMAHAVLKDKQGKGVGHVELTGTKSGVRLQLVLNGLPAGERHSISTKSENASPRSTRLAGISILKSTSMAKVPRVTPAICRISPCPRTGNSSTRSSTPRSRLEER